MSYLIRTGTGRNDIEFGGGKEIEGNYLRRIGNSINTLIYTQITSNDTNTSFMLLSRTSTGRNDIEWENVIMFNKSKQEEMMDLLFNTVNEMIIPSNELSQYANKFNMIYIHDVNHRYYWLLNGKFVKYNKYWILEYDIVDNNTNNFPQTGIAINHHLTLHTRENYYDNSNYDYYNNLRTVMAFCLNNTLMNAAYLMRDNSFIDRSSSINVKLYHVGQDNGRINFNHLFLSISNGLGSSQNWIKLNRPMYFEYP